MIKDTILVTIGAVVITVMIFSILWFIGVSTVEHIKEKRNKKKSKIN